MAMPEQTNAANGNTMIQRSELATIKKGSMKIAFISSFHLHAPGRKPGISLPSLTFALRVVLICYDIWEAVRMPPSKGLGEIIAAEWRIFC